MIDEPSTNQILEMAAHKLAEADGLMENIELQQHKLIDHLHTLLHHVSQLTSELNIHRLRADYLELERNQWHAKCEDALAELATARRRLVEMAYRAGEMRCPNCGSDQLAVIRGNFPTGVAAPDGGEERWYECALDCQTCGHREEVV